MHSDEYVVLIEAAKNALCDLLRASEADTGMASHPAYNFTKNMLAKDAGTSSPDRAQTETPVIEPSSGSAGGWDEWKRGSNAARLVLEAIGDNHLGQGQILTRVLASLDCRGSYVELRPTLQALVAAGEVCCSEVPGWRAGPRWQYSRNADLRGPIAELDRQFNDDGGPA